MIDTGSEVNLFKQNEVPLAAGIAPGEFFTKGIDGNKVKSEGTVSFFAFGEEIELSVVPKDFPTLSSCILGIDFRVAGRAKRDSNY